MPVSNSIGCNPDGVDSVILGSPDILRTVFLHTQSIHSADKDAVFCQKRDHRPVVVSYILDDDTDILVVGFD